MTGLRAAAQCIGAVQSNGNISVVEDFFGYSSVRGPTAAGLRISVRTQMSLLAGKHLHLNVIRVGYEVFSKSDVEQLDAAVALTRSFFASVGIGVGRLRPFFIPDAQAAEVGVVGSFIAFDDQAIALTDMFTVQNDALDVFIVLNWGVFSDQPIGRSEVDGPCDKDADACEMTGVVVSLSAAAATTGLTLAHELGHYLGLEHIGGLSSDALDLDGDGTVEPGEHAMFPTFNTNLMYPVNLDTNTQIQPAQGAVMKAHCFMKPGC